MGLPLLVALYSAGVALLCSPLDESAIGLGLRLQARLSFALYILALAGPGIHALVSSRWTAWLARRRSSLYQLFAFSHLIHAVWIVLYFERTPALFDWNLVNASGVAAFPLIGLLLFVHMPAVQRLYGHHWTRVERGIVAYVWLQFVGFFVDRLAAGRPELRPWYVVAIASSLAAAFVAWQFRASNAPNCAAPRAEAPLREFPDSLDR
jgi:hypothetical protein